MSRDWYSDYDPLGQLKTALGKEAGGTTNRLHEQFGFGYDAAGNVNQRTNNALAQTFNVNAVNELTTRTRTGTLTVSGETTGPATNVTVNTYSADIYGDYTFARAGFADGTNTFTAIAYGSSGMVDTNTISISEPATQAFAYDANGNLTSDGKRGLEYDDENQLVSVIATNQFKKEFIYDGLRRMRVRKEFAWIGSAWVQSNETHFIYDGLVIVQMRDANNAPTLSFTRGLDLSGSLHGAGGTGGLLAMTDHTQSSPLLKTALYHSDGNGNVTALLSTNGLIVARALFEPFGRPLTLSGPLASVNPFWFSSQLYDADTGFSHYLYRVYSPDLQRWLTKDPIDEEGGINLYGYAGNSPGNRFDTLGLWPYRDMPEGPQPPPTWTDYKNFFRTIYDWIPNQGGIVVEGEGAIETKGVDVALTLVLWDKRDANNIGLYTSFGRAGGCSLGAAGGIILGQDVTGCAYNLDVNVGEVSPTFTFDTNSYHLTQLTITAGPGIGVSVSETTTDPLLTVRDARRWWNRVGDWFYDKWTRLRNAAYGGGWG